MSKADDYIEKLSMDPDQRTFTINFEPQPGRLMARCAWLLKLDVEVVTRVDPQGSRFPSE
jgi:hypothetical protein